MNYKNFDNSKLKDKILDVILSPEVIYKDDVGEEYSPQIRHGRINNDRLYKNKKTINTRNAQRLITPHVKVFFNIFNDDSVLTVDILDFDTKCLIKKFTIKSNKNSFNIDDMKELFESIKSILQSSDTPENETKLAEFNKWFILSGSSDVAIITTDEPGETIYRYTYHADSEDEIYLKSKLGFHEMEDVEVNDKVRLSFYYKYKLGIVDRYDCVAFDKFKLNNDYGSEEKSPSSPDLITIDNITETWQKFTAELPIADLSGNGCMLYIFPNNVDTPLCLDLKNIELQYNLGDEPSPEPPTPLLDDGRIVNLINFIRNYENLKYDEVAQ